MTNKQFEQACNEFKQKFPKLQNIVIFIENDGDIYSSLEGDVIGTIRTLIDSARADHLQYSIFLTVGEMLRKDLSEEAIQSLTKLHLKQSLEKNVN
jgi:isocitrate dehydrogenase